MENPIIHLYTTSWNEKSMLPFFFEHYDYIVDKYFFYDDSSDDGTIEILEDHPNVEIRKTKDLEESSYILTAQGIYNNSWKGSIDKADWVIITPIDEFLYHPNFLDYLVDCHKAGVTAIPATGFQMISEFFPTGESSLIQQVKDGVPWQKMNKLSIFRPDQLTALNYSLSRHKAKPEGNVSYPETDELLNLHFKYLSIPFVYERHQALYKKMPDVDKRKAKKYSWDEERLSNRFQQIYKHKIHNVAKRFYREDYQKKNRHLFKWWQTKDLDAVIDTAEQLFADQKYRAVTELLSNPLKDKFATIRSQKIYSLGIRALLALNETNNAKALIEKALKDLPSNKQILLIKAKLLMANDELDNALLIYDEILSSKPDQTRIIHLKAICQFKLGQYENAEKSIESINASEKRTLGRLILLAKISTKLKRRDVAIGRWEDVLNLEKDHPEALKSIEMLKKAPAPSKTSKPLFGAISKRFKKNK